ncbi:MAG: Glutamate Aspartate periplasmic binding protein precursor GltI, partial [uncultured Ramlibacter sp.]
EKSIAGRRARRRRHRRGVRAGERHHRQGQGLGRDHHGRARFVRCPVLHPGRRQVRRLPRGDLPAHHRQPREGGRPQAGSEVPARDLAEPHPAGAERHRGHRVRLHHQQRHAPEGRVLPAHDLRGRSAHRRQGQLRRQRHQGPERQERGHHHGHHLGADAAQERARPGHRLQGSVRQGPRRFLPAARVRPCRRLRDGRRHPGRQHRHRQEPGRLQAGRRGAVGRADRHHDPQGRRRAQEDRRRHRQGNGQVRRTRQAVGQVVHAADPAEEHQGGLRRQREHEAGVGEPQRQADGRLRQEV